MGNGQGKPVDLDGEGELALCLAQSCHTPNHHEPTTPPRSHVCTAWQQTPCPTKYRAICCRNANLQSLRQLASTTFDCYESSAAVPLAKSELSSVKIPVYLSLSNISEKMKVCYFLSHGVLQTERLANSAFFFFYTTVVKSESVRNIIRERRMLEHVNHPFICNLRYSFQDIEYMYVSMYLWQCDKIARH